MKVDYLDLPRALSTADFLVEKQESNGEYTPVQHWGPEGQIYPALRCRALLEVFKVTQNPSYAASAKDILLSYRNSQQEEGCWALNLGPDGERFRATDKERAATYGAPDPIITGAVLRAVSEAISIGILDADMRYMGLQCMKFIQKYWSFDEQTFVGVNPQVEKLRSDPKAYNFLTLDGLFAWSRIGEYVDPNLFKSVKKSVVSTYLKFNAESMPLMVGYHAAVLAMIEDRSVVEDWIAPQLYDYLENNRFAASDVPGGFGHRDGLRGICVTELHLRSAVGLAMGMKAVDMSLGRYEFRSLGIYHDLKNWIDSMKSPNGGYYEYRDSNTELSCGYGSASIYLPIFWILGSFSRDA